jgi:hypothetical protein
VLVLCDNPFGPHLEDGLRGAGAEVALTPDPALLPPGKVYDAILVALTPRGRPVVGGDEALLTVREVFRRWPAAVVAQVWGDLDRDVLAAERVPYWPVAPVPRGHMGILPSAVGPEPVVRLQCGGLKVGEDPGAAVARDRSVPRRRAAALISSLRRIHRITKSARPQRAPGRVTSFSKSLKQVVQQESQTRGGRHYMPTYILGISGHFYRQSADAAAVLLRDGELIAGAEEERFIRIKHAPSQLPEEAIRFCLTTAGLRIGDVDVLAFPQTPWRDLDRNLPEFFEFRFGGRPKAIEYVDHHLAHAASAYRVSGFKDAMILTADWSGDGAALTLAGGRNGEITQLKRFAPPRHSLGIYYALITQYLGFTSGRTSTR